MVVFTCNNCGDSLQKPKVEKHYATACRSFKNLTCVDCLKDFKGEDYVAHIKCISEKERYAAKGSVTSVINKGEVKQQQWSDLIVEIVNSKTDLSGPHKLVFEIISNHIINVPRKKMKFMNFIKNAGGNRIMYPDIEKVWEMIEEYKTAQESKPEKETEDGNTESPKKKKKTKKSTEEVTAANEIDELKKNVEELGNTETLSEVRPKKTKKSKGESGVENSEATEDASAKRKLKNTEETIPEIVSPKKKKKSKTQEENGTVENGHTEDSQKSISNGHEKKNKKKNKSNGFDHSTTGEEEKMDVDTACHNESANVTTDSVSNASENLSDKILKVLKKKGSSSLTKLQKKVLKEYCQENNVEESPKLVKKFNKQLKKIEGIEVTDNNVRLLQA